jgi:hypothetical protein
VSSSTRETRSGNSLVKPLVNKEKTGVRTLENFGWTIWNTMLPKELKSCTSLDKFKESIKSWIPDNCDCVLCRINVKGV